MATDMTIVKPETDHLENEGKSLLLRATDLQVTDEESFKAMGEILLQAKNGIKAIEPQINEPVKKAHDLHKWLTGVRDKVLAPWRQTEMTAKTRMGAWQYEQEQKRRKELEKAAESARKKAEAEQIKAAEKAMDKGDLEKCEQILSTPVAPAVVQAKTPEPPKIAGVSFREDFDFVVEDVDAIPRIYMTPDVQMIRRVVKAQGKVCRIPGIRVVSKQIVAAGTGRAA